MTIFYRIIRVGNFWSLEMRNYGESRWYRIQWYDNYTAALKDKQRYEGAY